MNTSIRRMDGVVSELPTQRAARYGEGLLDRARSAWEYAQIAEAEQIREEGRRARDRMINVLVEAIGRTLGVTYPPTAVRFDGEGYAVAQLDQLVFRARRANTVEDQPVTNLVVLDADGIWHEVASLAQLGAVDERWPLLRVRS